MELEVVLAEGEPVEDGIREAHEPPDATCMPRETEVADHCEDAVTRARVGRVVALGASNLTRGLHTVVWTARALWGPQVEIFGALGHGRSYGARSYFTVRALPAILESGLWRELDARPQAVTRALVTDVGNDIMYGYSAEQTLEWVEEAVDRLQRMTGDIILTDLPIERVRRLSPARFLVYRSLVVPTCRLGLSRLLETAERVQSGLAKIAARRGIALVRLRSEWYGLDPIHMRPASWRTAWQEILGGGSPAGTTHRSRREALRLYFMRPERQWILGMEQYTPQVGAQLRSGGRVWLY